MDLFSNHFPSRYSQLFIVYVFCIAAPPKSSPDARIGSSQVLVCFPALAFTLSHFFVLVYYRDCVF